MPIRKSENDPAAEQEVTLEKDRRLPGCDISLRRVKLDPGLIPLQRRHQGLGLFRGIANLHVGAELLFRRLTREPINIASDQFKLTQFFLYAHDQRVCY